MKLFSVCVGNEGTLVECEEAPWYIHLIDHIALTACCWTLFKWNGKKYDMHDIPLPNWPKIFRIFDDDPEDERYTPKEMWGDLGGLIGNWLLEHIAPWSFKRKKGWCVPVSYQLLRPHLDAEIVKWIDEDFVSRKEHCDEQRKKTGNPAKGVPSLHPNTVCQVELREWQYDNELKRFRQETLAYTVVSSYHNAISRIKRAESSEKPVTPNVHWWYIFEEEVDNDDLLDSIKGRTMIDSKGNVIDWVPNTPLPPPEC